MDRKAMSVVGWLSALTLSACVATAPAAEVRPPGTPAVPSADPVAKGAREHEPRVVTLAFAGDVHFQLHLASLLDDPRGLGPAARALADADVAMVNLESAITERGVPDPKELEDPSDRYWFRAPPSALGFLARSGVDVVAMANNHGADYGPIGLQDTLRAAATGPLAVVGVGRDRRAAFTPHEVTVRGTALAFMAADASPRESAGSPWAAGVRSPGLAAAHTRRPTYLLGAVRAASRRVDVVVVYMHWGVALRPCPSADQRALADALVKAGADVIVGSHAHVPLGSGWLDGAYVNYGLGNFVWYHNGQPDTGVLRLRLEDGEVVSDGWTPARIGTWGVPRPLAGAARERAVASWRDLRGCAGLTG